MNKSLVSLVLRAFLILQFLDKDGNKEGNVVGCLPKQYFYENAEALGGGEASAPRAAGRFSSAESRKVHQVVDPRSHDG